MANRMLKPLKGCLEAGIVKLYGNVTTGSSGAISSNDCRGFSISKVAATTGRYLITLQDGYIALRGVSVTLVGSASSAMTAGAATGHYLRSVDVTTNKQFTLQFVNGDTDAEVDTNVVFYLEITLKDSQAY